MLRAGLCCALSPVCLFVEEPPHSRIVELYSSCGTCTYLISCFEYKAVLRGT